VTFIRFKIDESADQLELHADHDRIRAAVRANVPTPASALIGSTTS
jgi:hypothetical protein